MDRESILAAIAAIQVNIQSLERQLAERKRTVNGLCAAVGDPAIYPDAEPSAVDNHFGIQSDSYYGRPLASAVRDILVRRKNAGLGAAPLSAIFTLMKMGGFRFEAKNDGTATRSLAIALSKNPAFVRLPGGDSVGLAEWYGKSGASAKKEQKETAAAKSDADAADEEEYRNDFAEPPADDAEETPVAEAPKVAKPAKK